MDKEKYLKIFTNCVITKGYSRSLILDTQRGGYTTIPDTMCDVIEKFLEKKSIEEVYKLYEEDNKCAIEEYISFLINNEFAFFTNSQEFDLFIDMNTNFEMPSYISNCIIEISSHNLLFINKIVTGLENLYCKNLQFVGYENIEIKDFKYLLKKTKNTNFRSIEFILKFSSKILEFISEINKNNFRVTNLVLHSSKDKVKECEKTSFYIDFIDYEINSFKNCGIIDSKYFNVNKDKVLESLNHNSCLHKKISIDKEGNIKNCPSMAENFGNIKCTTLEEALNHPHFKKYWNITKDQIEVCKDCEFRHVCTDCRAYVEEPNNQYSKPLKCGYNPYTNVWEEWSTNPLKQKAIEFYEMQDLLKKAHKTSLS